MIRECAVCGKMFEVPNFHNKTKVCSEECRKIKNRNVYEARYERIKQQRQQQLLEQTVDDKINRKIQKKQPKQKPLSFAEIQKKAREENLTYGQYVAKYRL